MYDLEGFENDRGTILDVVLDAVQMVTNSQLSAMQNAGLQYYRLEPTLTAAQEPMDSISTTHINSLIATANAYLANEGATTFSNIITALQ